MPSFSALLLAGGRSSRMGRDKALLPVAGSGLLLWQHQLQTVAQLEPDEIFWSGTARPGLPAQVRVVLDAVIDAGPLAGISAGLEALQSDLLLVLAIDMPQMTSEFLRALLSKCTDTCGAVVQHGEYFEPLAAIYPRGLRTLAAEHLREGKYSLQELIRDALRENFVQAWPLDAKEAPLFRNVNSPADATP